MKAEIVNAFIHVVAPWFTDEDLYTIRRGMSHELGQSRRKPKES
jgi:hypothetical protein